MVSLLLVPIVPRGSWENMGSKGLLLRLGAFRGEAPQYFVDLLKHYNPAGTFTLSTQNFLY